MSVKIRVGRVSSHPTHGVQVSLHSRVSQTSDDLRQEIVHACEGDTQRETDPCPNPVSPILERLERGADVEFFIDDGG